MRSKDYFDQVADQWDHLQASFYSEKVRDRALATAAVQAGDIAADIGCGSGFITEGLIRAGLHVIAVDQSEAMLAAMKRKFAGIAEVDCRCGEAAQLPIADGSVDYAFANMYLHHVEKPAIAIKEMARILKPGGTLVITDLDTHTSEFLRDEHHDRWLGFDRGDIRQWFREAGLGRVVVNCVKEQCCAESDAGNGSASVSIFVASGEQ